MYNVFDQAVSIQLSLAKSEQPECNVRYMLHIIVSFTILSTRYNPSREVSILRLCQGHPNIIRLHEVYTDELHVYIVMELMRGGELLDRLKMRHSFTEAEASAIFQQLVSAVSFMHQKKVVHRDLKPEVHVQISVEMLAV